MILQRNLLECVTIVSCTGTVICVLLNYVTSISPISGIWFPLYIFSTFIISVLLSFKLIQWLLSLNKPIKYDLEHIIENYPYLSFLSQVAPHIYKKPKVEEYKEYDTNELSVISTVLERKLVSSWYVPYVSQEIGFPFACKQMLDQMIGKTFQICNKIETEDVFVDVCTVLTTHLKEYKKALKRYVKSPSSSIESLYKKTHPISDENKKCESADHCTYILRVILKELTPWELWDTPHSELLVRILAKKLDNFIVNTLVDPVWLNDKLLSILDGKSKGSNVGEKIEAQEELVKETVLATDKTESLLPTSEEKIPVPIVEKPVTEKLKIEALESRTVEGIVEEVPVTSSEPVEIKSSPIMRQKRGRQGKNEVKIYDRIIEGSVKTWETDVDLQCISMGQDLLASLDGEITLSRLWGHEEPDGSPNPPRSKSPQPLWFGEEDTIDMELADVSPHKKELSPKPADALLRDLQSTVSQAKTKIGDLQVENHVDLDVNRKHTSDEAAGMMEGLLDFGIAGLKKGLRFTGLSDDSQEKSPLHKERLSDKSPPAETTRTKIMESREGGITQLVQKEDIVPSAPPLLKQQRVTSQDSVMSSKQPAKGELPLPPLSDSPEPEYEEAADLSTSIAKLRCLLQQRAETSPRAEDIWWESAEETRGRTQHHHSSKPVDTATLADEYDMSAERNSSPGQAYNNMQRLDKLFQRTVTGVFNSIKTAVGAEGEETSPRPLHDWTYVCTSAETSVGGAVARLVGSRRAFTHVDAALDSLEHLAPATKQKQASPPEDFEEWCAGAGARWSGSAAVAAELGLLTSHLAARLAALLLADLVESLIDAWLKEFAAWLRREIFVVFEQLADQDSTLAREKATLRPFHTHETCEAILNKIPMLLPIFGKEMLTTAVKMAVCSFSHREVNMDVMFRLVDLFALQFKKSAGVRNPSFDAN